MLRNYLTTAYRNLLRHKLFSLINILGLAIGLVAVLCIYLFISFELSYDRFHQKADRIYLVNLQLYKSHQISVQDYSSPAILAQAFRDELPEVAQAVRLLEGSAFSKPVIAYQEKVFNETGVFFADAKLPDVLSIRFLAGNPATALLKPQAVVLTKPIADKYFGTHDPMGKMLQIDQKPYEVTGIIEPFPANSHLQVNVLISMEGLPDAKHPTWLANAFHTYILLKEGATAEELQAKIDKLTQKHMGPEYQQVLGRSLASERAAGDYIRYTLKALKDIHLYSANNAHGDITYVYLFGCIAFLILLIACANYINLTTAKATHRAREVGVRKVLGAGKWQLLKLFLTESVSITLIAGVLALTLVQAMMLLGDSLSFSFIPYGGLPIDLFWVLLMVVAFAGVISGIVPAWYISAYQPVQVLKGVLTSGTKGEGLRKVFVIIQFTISTVLILGTLLVKEQVFLLQNKHLGFDKENVIVISNIDKIGDKQQVLKEALRSESAVVQAAFSYNVVGEPYNWDAFTPVAELEKLGRSAIGIPRFVGDSDLLRTLDIELVMGQNFRPNVNPEHPQIILNEEAINRVGWQSRSEEEIIGQLINVNGFQYELTGVAKNFNFTSLKQAVSPFAMVSYHPYSKFDHLLVRVKPGNVTPLLETIRQHWLRLAPETPFQYTFLDEHLNRLYQSEQQVASVMNVFSGLAIIVACLGLLGLALFTVERRTKEIGVRKVLGASVANILLLLSKDFIKLVLLANLIAWPLAYWGISKWLENYAFSVEISPWLFILPSVLVLAIALLTISFQTIKAARANPVKSLRNE